MEVLEKDNLPFFENDDDKQNTVQDILKDSVSVDVRDR